MTAEAAAPGTEQVTFAPRRGWRPDGPLSLGVAGLWLSIIAGRMFRF